MPSAGEQVYAMLCYSFVASMRSMQPSAFLVSSHVISRL